ERPGAGHLEEADAELRRTRLVDAEFIQRLAHVQIALAGRDDAELGVWPSRIDDPVEVVRPDEGGEGGALVFVEPCLLPQHVDLVADMQPARWQVDHW